MQAKVTDVSTAIEALARGECSSLQLTQQALERIALSNRQLNIFWHVAADSALAAAHASDLRRARGESYHPLDGVPISLKDNIACQDMPLTAGMATRRTLVARDDAYLVSKLRKAGMVILGKVSMHEAALGADNDNPHFGACHNPLRAGYTPGGSSGGSAAAVTAGMGFMSVGTDSMGSCRIPAAYCGVVGMKASHGRISQRGLVPVSRRLDGAGPLVASVRDLHAVYHVLSGLDWRDPESTSVPLRHAETPQRLGFLPPSTLALEPVVAEAYQRALDTIKQHFVLVEVKLELDFGAHRRAGLILCEAEMARFHQAELEARPELFSNALLKMLQFGAKLSATRLVEAQNLVDQALISMRSVFQDLDVLLTPTTPQTAFAFGTPAPANQADFTALANLSKGPGISMPIPVAAEQLPVGLQLLGAPGSDLLLIAFANRLQDLFDQEAKAATE
jgi:aspartyl-tRNA(Asn)/glutamyl-tRNA(Gln) amidotransferase subunit A